jgi:hypothetical protein
MGVELPHYETIQENTMYARELGEVHGADITQILRPAQLDAWSLNDMLNALSQEAQRVQDAGCKTEDEIHGLSAIGQILWYLNDGVLSQMVAQDEPYRVVFGGALRLWTYFPDEPDRAERMLLLVADWLPSDEVNAVQRENLDGPLTHLNQLISKSSAQYVGLGRKWSAYVNRDAAGGVPTSYELVCANEMMDSPGGYCAVNDTNISDRIRSEIDETIRVIQPVIRRSEAIERFPDVTPGYYAKAFQETCVKVYNIMVQHNAG